MQINELIVVRLTCGIVATYVIYSLMNQFLHEGKYNKIIEVISYIAYFTLSMVCYCFIQIPIIVLVFNVVSFIIISMNYIADVKQRLIAVVYIYCILFIIEMLVAAATGYIYFPLKSASRYSSIFGQIANQLLGLITVVIIRVQNKRHKYVSLPWVYWFCIIAIPVFSLFFLVILFHVGELGKIYTLLNIFFLLIVNFSVIILYDLVIESIGTKTERLLLEQQNKSYEEQLKIMQAAFKENRSLQHDLREHLLTLKIYLGEGMTQQASRYIDKMLDVGMMNKNEISKSGNTIIDSILNFKLQKAVDKGIHITTSIRVPEKLKIDSFDITVILGNILDNAIDAAYKVEEDKEIHFCLIYDRGRLMIGVDNPYIGVIKTENGMLVTSKEESLFHGIGLQNVETVVNKYCGITDISYDEKWFKINVMIYV